jgi:phosphate acetyltransferase
MKDPLWYGAMMVRKGLVDSFVGGALYTTGDVCRAGIQIIGMQPGLKTLSSFFAMVVSDKSFGKDGIIFFADCAVVPAPDVNQLADIAIATADSYASLTGDTPRVAMLSFSTKGSAKHADIDKVVAATAAAKAKRPGLIVDGELQGDAALIPAIGERKAKGSPVAGKANVLIFPDLDAGNISYKLVERLGKAEAVGPILQGMAKPSSDLSRGCKAADVLNVIAINVVRVQFAQKQ